jgi:hypothetical protein
MTVADSPLARERPRNDPQLPDQPHGGPRGDSAYPGRVPDRATGLLRPRSWEFNGQAQSPISASWNQLRGWLRAVDGLRRVA